MATEKNGAPLIAALRKAFFALGTPDGKNGTRVPNVNDSNLELAIAKVLDGFAAERASTARVSVMAELANELKGANATRMNVFTSKHSTLDVQLVKGQARVNKDALRLILAKRLGIKVADEIIAEASVVSEPSLRLFPSIVSVDD
jgi:hypothetical protein